jgi:hypothetical protein
VVKGTFKYKHKLVKGQRGAITSWVINFTKGTFALKANKVDLTGLGCPLQLETKFGLYITRGVASENIVNNSKNLPTRLMRTYKNTLIVSKASARNSANPASDSFTVKGDIAVADINDANLNDPNLWVDDVNITWGDQTFMLPSHSFKAAKTGHSYKSNKAPATEGGLITAQIDLDKCTFTISVSGVNLVTASGDVVFGVHFADFNQTAVLHLP